MDDIKVGGHAFEELFSSLDVDTALKEAVEESKKTTSVAKRDKLIKKIKYLKGLKNQGIKDPSQHLMLRHIPVLPPNSRPVTVQSGNRLEFADVNYLYKDHILVNDKLKELKEFLPDEELIAQRKDMYAGAKAIMGLGDPISPDSRGRGLKGLITQVGGETGPKTGVFHGRILNRKQDLSGRATIAAAPHIGFNEAEVPEDILWTMYEPHLLRHMTKNGYDLLTARDAIKDRRPAAQAAFNHVTKDVPVLVNRAPTLMRSNIMAVMPRPIKGSTVGINPLHLPGLAGDFDGDAVTLHVPVTPEAIHEAKANMLPQNMIYDLRKGLHATLYQPGHEAILGSMHLTEPDHKQKVVEFATEAEALEALKEGKVKENTPIRIKAHE